VIETGSSDKVSWRKSKYSTGNGECVEAGCSQGDMTVRDSKQPDGPKLRYSEFAWRSFLVATKLGNFDVQQ
jgi:Domain of unknown function (DUF397)